MTRYKEREKATKRLTLYSMQAGEEELIKYKSRQLKQPELFNFFNKFKFFRSEK